MTTSICPKVYCYTPCPARWHPFLSHFIFMVIMAFILLGCNREIVVQNKPATEHTSISALAKSDIDDVLDLHISQSKKLLKKLMIKLYKRNPRELKKSELKLPEEHIVRLFDLKHDWRFPELQGTHDLNIIRLTFSHDYQSDRVFSFIAGLWSMILKSYNYQSEFYLFDSTEPQKLYNCARNIEIAFWKLKHNRNPKGELFLYSTPLPNEVMANAGYERLFGKLVATQDNIALIMAGKKKRTIKTIIQRMAIAVFLPI